jgi:hypothetical protein
VSPIQSATIRWMRVSVSAACAASSVKRPVPPGNTLRTASSPTRGGARSQRLAAVPRGHDDVGDGSASDSFCGNTS